MKENEKKNKRLLSPTGEKIIEYMKRKPVGGHIPSSEYDAWEKYKGRCNQAGVSVSCEGFLDMLKTHNKINDVMFPIANSYGYSPLKFKNEMIDVLLRTVQSLDNKKMIKESDKLHSEILDDTSETLLVKLREKVEGKG